MSQISFTFWNKYFVKLSNHGYVEIYDNKCLSKLPRIGGGWIYRDVETCLLSTYECDSGVVDHDSMRDCRAYARYYLDIFRKTLTPRYNNLKEI